MNLFIVFFCAATLLGIMAWVGHESLNEVIRMGMMNIDISDDDEPLADWERDLRDDD